MKYCSTRGQSTGQSFESVVLEGLAPDGGLFIPEQLPELPADWQTAWAEYSFSQLATELISLFVGDDLTRDEVKTLVERSYSTFDSPAVTPVVDLGARSDAHVLELFHGPTFAFKDVALQFLGNLFEFFLIRRGGSARLTVVGATSGDTGSAAIYGLRGKRNVDVFILHPKGRVSPVQEAQMTTVLDPNVHNVAVTGTFDDCQDIVKQLFGRPEFRRQYSLGAVNSINWARILAQITYYFYAYFALARRGLAFVVPSGNFGDVLAGFYAQELGLPVKKLVVATNANDILDRFLRTGTYEKNAELGVHATPSPAMDILVSSNFERFLWYLARDHEVPANVTDPQERAKQASAILGSWMDRLKTSGSFSVSPASLEAARRVFWSGTCSDEQTYATIARHYPDYLLDPHTAVGVHVAESLSDKIAALGAEPVCLSTAHPAKFSEAVLKAVNGAGHSLDFGSILPKPFIGLLEKPRRCHECSNDTDAVADYIAKTVGTN
ncbi:threonine synthase [Coemansia sp. RSA 552]|nr:threonine synthase [Coemansia sp. RSA 552]